MFLKSWAHRESSILVTATSGNQSAGQITALSHGDFAVTSTDFTGAVSFDGTSLHAIHAQVFSSGYVATEQTSLSLKGADRPSVNDADSAG